jgi:hypothetical protein
MSYIVREPRLLTGKVLEAKAGEHMGNSSMVVPIYFVVMEIRKPGQKVIWLFLYRKPALIYN